MNLTPVEADGAGDGQLVSSDVTSPPVASNVNFGPGTVDPNVAVAPIGADGQVCYVNSVHTSVHLVADHLGTIAAGSFLQATSSGAPNRTIDTRGGGKLGPSGRRCFPVAGSPGDAALVNLTPVEADGAGDGQLVSSDVTSPPVASNVNFGPGTVDPNVAVAPIGADGQVCYVNSVHTSVHLVADHLGTIAAGSFLQATSSGAPNRTIDTRTETPPPPTAQPGNAWVVWESAVSPDRINTNLPQPAINGPQTGVMARLQIVSHLSTEVAGEENDWCRDEVAFDGLAGRETECLFVQAAFNVPGAFDPSTTASLQLEAVITPDGRQIAVNDWSGDAFPGTVNNLFTSVVPGGVPGSRLVFSIVRWGPNFSSDNWTVVIPEADQYRPKSW